MNNTPEQNSNSMTELFGAPIYVYSRRQAVADGVQVEIPAETSAEAGLRFPVYLTAAVFAQYVRVPAGVEGQDEAGRLWDVLWMLACAIRANRAAGARLAFRLYVRNTNRRPKLVELVCEVGPRDHDDPAPAMTIRLPDED